MKRCFSLATAVVMIAISSCGLVIWSVALWQSNIDRLFAIEIVAVLLAAVLESGGLLMVWAWERSASNG